MFQFILKRTKFSNHKTIQILIQVSLLRVMMFEMTNYTRDLLGTRLLPFGHLVPLPNCFVLYTDPDQSEQFLTSATVFFCKLVRVVQQYVGIAGVAQLTLYSETLTVLLVQIANSGEKSSFVD